MTKQQLEQKITKLEHELEVTKLKKQVAELQRELAELKKPVNVTLPSFNNPAQMKSPLTYTTISPFWSSGSTSSSYGSLSLKNRD